MKNKTTIATIQMITCAALWSIAGLFIKMVPWGPFGIAGARSFFAACVLGVYLLIKKQRIIFTKRSILGAIIMAGTFLSFVFANKNTTAANAIVLQFTSPIFIMILSGIFFKKRFAGYDILAVVLTVAGIALFFFGQLDSGGTLGNVAGIVAGLFMASMFVVTGEVSAPERMSAIFLGQVLTACIGIPFLIAEAPIISGQSVLYIAILGIFQLGIPYLLYGLAVRYISPLSCCLIGGLEPILNPVWVLIFTGETPTIFALFGGIVVVATVTIWSIYSEKRRKLAVSG